MATLQDLKQQRELIDREIITLETTELVNKLKVKYTILPEEGVYLAVLKIQEEDSIGVLTLKYNSDEQESISIRGFYTTLKGEQRQIFNNSLIESDGVLKGEFNNIVISQLSHLKPLTSELLNQIIALNAEL